VKELLIMVKVFTAKNSIEANIVKGMLEVNDIPAYVEGEYLQGAIGELAAIDFAFVSVDEVNESKALNLVNEYETGSYSVSV
jgi:putative signal transducing protein